jgi:DNA-binding response OmpR family regulator
MAGNNILVVDDETHITQLVSLYLTKEGYTVYVARTGTEALQLVHSTKPALVVLDLMLPEIDGWEVCRRIRRESDVPIIMLTARSDDVDKIVGLELGADDYLTKPFNPRELVARVKAVLRRALPSGQAGVGAGARAEAGIIELGNTHIDQERREVIIAGRQVDLRFKEFDLLVAFATNLGKVLDRDRLLNMVWGYEYFGDTRTVDVHVAHLRDKLAGSDLAIQTVRGLGYKMVLKQA